MKYQANGRDKTYIDYEKLAREDPELYEEYIPLLEELEKREELDVSYLTDGKLLLSKGACSICHEVGMLKFS